MASKTCDTSRRKLDYAQNRAIDAEESAFRKRPWKTTILYVIIVIVVFAIWKIERSGYGLFYLPEIAREPSDLRYTTAMYDNRAIVLIDDEPVRIKIVGWAIEYNHPKTRRTYRQWYVPPECTGCAWKRESPAGKNPKTLRLVSQKVLEDMNQ